ncbi:MAG: LytTR family transcriptional regulator [Clostridia bacterium]|nr:LytTR family transcriptional regulator [Clostridia bacterium]
MKYSIVIDREREEEVLIYAHERNKLVERLEEVLEERKTELVGFSGDEIVRIVPNEALCFTVEEGKTYAVTERGKYLLKLRLYQLEESVGHSFLKINQSCIVNIDKIESFKTSLGGSLMVTLKGGYRDYVSRRQLKAVKERIGF